MTITIPAPIRIVPDETAAAMLRTLHASACRAEWPAERKAAQAIANALFDANNALIDWDCLTSGTPWYELYPALESPDPEFEARQITAQQIRDCHGALTRAYDTKGAVA